MNKYRIIEKFGWGRPFFTIQKKNWFGFWEDSIDGLNSTEEAEKWITDYMLRCGESKVIKEI